VEGTTPINSKMEQLSYSIKVLKATDILDQISRELNQPSLASTNNMSSNANVQNSSMYTLPTNEHPTEPFSLRDIRKCLPKIEKFDGSVDK